MAATKPVDDLLHDSLDMALLPIDGVEILR
jgi:hypothetical protein